MSPDEAPSPPVIAVIDTSILIEFKQVVGIDQQWDLLMETSTRVTAGAVAFRRQVVAELSAVVDHLPVKIALKTACDRVGVSSCPLTSLIGWLNDPIAPLPPHADVE